MLGSTAVKPLPKIISPSNMGAITTDNGAHHYRFIAIEVSVPASIGNTGLVRLGTGYETTLAQLPHDLVLDRMDIHGTPTGNLRRSVILNGASEAVIDSYLSDNHEHGADSQALGGWNGSGPFKIVNNYLEASTENVLFGGSVGPQATVIPSDIESRHNYLTKPVGWRTSVISSPQISSLTGGAGGLLAGGATYYYQYVAKGTGGFEGGQGPVVLGLTVLPVLPVSF